MHLTFVGHAQLLVRAAGKTLLLDPWFGEPVFAHAWWRYPPPPFPTPASLPHPPDAVLLSHAHPDHSGPETLAQLDTSLPIFAPPFAHDPLPRRLAKAGFRHVSWMKPYETREPWPGIKVTYVPHDKGWKVCSIVVEAEGVRLYHGNDNPLTLAGYRALRERLGPIDIAFLPFAGASSFPTCFEWDRETMLEQAARKKAEGIRRLTDGIEGLQPKVAVPFASSWALLEEKDLWKNFVDRPTPQEAEAGAKEVAAKTGTQVLVLDPGDEWTPEADRSAKGLTAGWTYDAEGAARYAATQKERVEAALKKRDTGEGFPKSSVMLGRAMQRYFKTMLEDTRETTKDLTMVASFVGEGEGGGAWTVRFEQGKDPRFEEGRANEADETLTLPAAELWSVCTSAASWEDSWYGYRLRVKKREGAGYYRGFWEMLLGYDDEELSERVRWELGR